MLGGELAVALSFICLKFKVQVSAEGINPEVKKKHFYEQCVSSSIVFIPRCSNYHLHPKFWCFTMFAVELIWPADITDSPNQGS